MNTRKDSQGNKVLFLEEIQGDFPQEYRKQQNLINDYVDKNSAKVIEEFKKKGILEVICP
jgi:predicted RNase H-like nuclease